MDLFAPFVRNVLVRLSAYREGTPYLRHHKTLLRTQYDSPEVIRSRQFARVRELLDHAYDASPFWRERLDAHGIRPESIRDFDDFRAVPVLTKADIRARGASMLARGYDRATLRHKSTSGSTGVPLEVWVDEPAMQWKRACTLRSDEWSGWRLGERVAMVWGNPEYLKEGWWGRLRNALLDRACYLDTLKMDAATMERYVCALKRKPVALIFGHAHSVYLLAEFMKSRGLGGIHPRGIITTAMVLHGWQRRMIEEVFGCKVTNRYGCEEVSLIACECERHEGLHVNADGMYVELISDGRPAEPGEPGSVVVTDLFNRAMPILRYQVGDMAVAAPRPCSCGRGLPLLEQVEGREADYVITPAGVLVSGISLTENFAMLVPGIAQIQIIQEAVDRFTFRIVRGDDFGPASEGRIATLVLERFGPDVRHELEFVDRIPQEPSGKYRFCISRVPNHFAAAPQAVGHE